MHNSCSCMHGCSHHTPDQKHTSGTAWDDINNGLMDLVKRFEMKVAANSAVDL